MTERRPSLLEDKVVAITGAGSGIGRATARLAAAEGACGLVLADRDGDGLEATVSELDIEPSAVQCVVGSITDRSCPDSIVEAAVTRHGRLDAAVNNAGVRGELSELHDLTDEQFDDVIDINLRAVFRCMRAQLRQMYSQGSGSIVNIGSASVLGVSQQLAPYVASKMGVIGLMKVASKEAGRRGVRVNVVCPGRTDTPLLNVHHNSGFVSAEEAVKPIPLGRFGRPSELADAIVFLCSERSSFVNGANLIVDGGRTG
jgi:NAD(P)-dependent dehydrogenase (short-subunit alcohol dehydrogenase family)